jgi:EAL domain-containing protein (putative c-di-GMP-specific phosphodiesterase class I)
MGNGRAYLTGALAAASAVLFLAAIWAVVAWGWSEAAFAAAIILIGAAFAYHLHLRDSDLRADINALAGLAKGQDELRRDVARLNSIAAERAAPQRAAHPNAGLIDEVKSLRASIQSLAQDAAIPAAAAATGPRLDNDKLELLLEPVVAFETGETVHYRASLSLAAAAGHQLAGAALLREADRTGLRPSLDFFCAQRVIPALARIQARRPEARVFAPVSAQSIASASHLGAIAESLVSNPAVARAIVFEIDHAAMASLDTAGIEGLARLAQSGASFALARANPSGIELGPLKDLRFRHLIFEAMTLPQSAQIPPLWSGLARFAQHQGFTIVVANAENEAQARAASTWADYGCGAAFAPPRLVRSDLAAPARRAAA